MRNFKSKIALDLDGVIWDLVDPWVNNYNLLYDDNIKTTDIKEYKLSSTLTKATSEELHNILLQENFWNNVFPFPNAFEYLDKLNNEYDLYIATKTDYRIYEIKVNRVLKLFPFIKPEQIICINNKSLLDVDWLVDDCADNLNGNYNKILLDASYNRSNYEFIRAKDLKEVYNIIKFMEMN